MRIDYIFSVAYCVMNHSVRTDLYKSIMKNYDPDWRNLLIPISVFKMVVKQNAGKILAKQMSWKVMSLIHHT